MVKTISLAASTATLLSTVVCQQFVLYTPGGDDTAIERIDPIISPGKLSGHVHQVFGSSGLGPDVSYESLQQADCTTMGSADGGMSTQDKSIYWHPALYMEATGGGYIKVPTNGHKLYYRDAGSGKTSDGFNFPRGFRMIAGDPFNRASTQDNALTWTCYNGGENHGVAGAFPTGVTNCADYPYLKGQIEFPHCWNGVDYSPSNPSAHMSYPEPAGDPLGGSCPSSHPIRVPHITMENFFDIGQVVGQAKAASFVLAQGDDTGYGWHADFFNGWTDGAIYDILNSCPQGEYGNHDVGTCSNFQSSGKTSSCRLPATYKEDVTNPGDELPGCNPISKQNPAPMMDTAALNQHCNGASAGGGSGGNSSASAHSSASSAYSLPANSEPAGSQPASSDVASSHAANSYAAPSTARGSTFATFSTNYPAGSAAPSSRKGGHNHYGHGHHHARPTWWG